MPKFEDPHFKSAYALIGEYGRAHLSDVTRLAEQRSGTTTSTTSSSSSRPSSATRKGSSRVQLSSRDQVQQRNDDRDDSSTTASCSIPSYDPREGRSDGGVAIIKTLDADIFIDYCERCGDYEDARIRWVETSKDGGNSYTCVVGQECAMNRRGWCARKVQRITESEGFVGCCFRCNENFLCYDCAWERVADRGVIPPSWQRAQLDDGPMLPSTVSKDKCWIDWGVGPGACFNGRFCGYRHSRPDVRRNRDRGRSYYGSMD
jgi:hypothetical protein